MRPIGFEDNQAILEGQAYISKMCAVEKLAAVCVVVFKCLSNLHNNFMS